MILKRGVTACRQDAGPHEEASGGYETQWWHPVGWPSFLIESVRYMLLLNEATDRARQKTTARSSSILEAVAEGTAVSSQAHVPSCLLLRRWQHLGV